MVTFLDQVFDSSIYRFPGISKLIGRNVLHKRYPYPVSVEWRPIQWLPSISERESPLILKNAIVCPNSSLIIHDGFVKLERVSTATEYEASYAARPLLDHGSRFAVLERKTFDEISINSDAFSLFGNGDFNYYHWLVEILPKLSRLQTFDLDFKKMVLLVPVQVRETPQMKEALSRVNHQEIPIMFLEPGQLASVNTLFWLPSPIYSVFNKRGKSVYRQNDFEFTSKELLTYRKQLGLQLSNLETSTRSKRIFLSRPPSRRPYNEDEIYELFANFGFEKVRTDLLTFEEQVNLFESADSIAGPTGASWTNLLFVTQSIHCFYWRPEEYGDLRVFEDLASLSGSRMHNFVFNSGAKSMAELYNRPYLVPFDRLKEIYEPYLEGL